MIRRDILEYLGRHPGAQDTVEGIVRWWLLEQKIRHVTGLTQTVLDALVDEGWLDTRQGPDGRRYYCARPEAADRLQQPEWADESKRPSDYWEI